MRCMISASETDGAVPSGGGRKYELQSSEWYGWNRADEGISELVSELM